MNIYKKASVSSFNDPNAAEQIVKAKVFSIKKRNKKDLKEFTEFLSFLSEIQNAVKQTGISPSEDEGKIREVVIEKIENIFGGSNLKEFITTDRGAGIIDAIGFQKFISTNFSEISRDLEEIAKREFGPIEPDIISAKPPITPATPPQAVEEAAEEVTKEDDDLTELQDQNSTDNLVRQLDAFSNTTAKVKAFMNFSYHEKVEYLDYIMSFDFAADDRIISKIYVNIIEVLNTQEDLSEKLEKKPNQFLERNFNQLSLELADAMDTLLNRFSTLKKADEEKSLEGQDDVSPEVARSGGVDLNEAQPEEDEESAGFETAEDKEEKAIQKVRFQAMVATITEGEATREYIDFSPLVEKDIKDAKPPVLDINSLDTEYVNFTNVITDLFRRSKSVPHYSPVLAGIGKKLNEILYLTKMNDWKNYNKLKEIERKFSVIPSDLSPELRKLHIDIRNSIIEIKNKFIENCVSTRVRAGASVFGASDIFDVENDLSTKFKIYGIAVKIGAPQTSKFIFPQKDTDAHLYMLRGHPDERVTPAVYVDIQQAAAKIVEDRFNKKIVEFFDLDRGSVSGNFIESISLLFTNVINASLSKLYPKEQDYELKPCPVCHRWVPWSFGKSTRVARESLGFSGYIFSPFREDANTQELSPITEEELNEPGKKWTVLPPELYSSSEERKFIVSLQKQDKKTGGKTWKEIQSLLRSSNSRDQREGWHRRSAAYAMLGGKKLSAKDRKIKDLTFRCPTEPVLNPEATKSTEKKKGISGGSYCGATISPKRSKHLSPSIAFQPQWNGVSLTTKDEDSRNPGVKAEEWQDPESLEFAERQLSGGYKFSSLSFACTCRITNPDSTASALHGNFVISQAGSAGTGNFVYPTKPNGQEDRDIAPGTTTFMVCAAPTSISSFDKNDENDVTFIFTYLASTKEKSVQDYYNFLNYLVLQGMDPQDIATLNSDLDRYLSSTAPTESKMAELSIKDRMLKISKILTASTARSLYAPSTIKNIDPKEMLKGLYLVCPFGHRFNVGHSLRFGGAYSAIFRYSKRDITSKYPELVQLEGLENSEALINSGLLVEPQRMGAYKYKMVYEEWKKQPEEERIVFPQGNDFDKALLIFRIPTDDQGTTKEYVFSKKIPGSADSVWSESGSFSSRKTDRKYIPYKHLEESERIDKETGRSNVTDVGDSGQSTDDLDVENLEIAEGYQLPGTQIYERLDLEMIQRKKEKFLPIVSQKVQSLGEALKKSLNIIDSYTRGMVSRSMLNAFMVDITEKSYDKIMTPDLISKISAAFSSSVGGEPCLIIYDEDGNPTDDVRVKSKVYADLARIVSEKLKPRIEALDQYIKDNIFSIRSEDFDRDLSVRILAGAVSEALSDPDIMDYAIINEDVLPSDPAQFFADSITKNTNSIISVITRDAWIDTKETAEKKYTYGARIVYVAYALKLSRILSGLYKKYCRPESKINYIGYNIGIDLSNPDEIMGMEVDGRWVGGLTPELINKIIVSYQDIPPNELSILMGNLPDRSPRILKLDRFFMELRIAIEAAGTEVLSPLFLEDAKEYIVDRLKIIAPQARDIIDTVESSMPTKTLRLSYDPTRPETHVSNFYKKRIPYVSKSPQFFRSLNVSKVWIVRSKTYSSGQNYTAIFDSEEAAKEYQANLPISVRSGYTVEEDFYYVSPPYKAEATRITKGTSVSKKTEFKNIKDPGFSLLLEGSEFYILEVQNVKMGFQIACKNRSGETISIPYNQSLLEAVGPNRYFVKFELPEELHQVSINSSENFIVDGAIPSTNFDSSRLQIGRIVPVNKSLTKWYSQEWQWDATLFGNGDPRRPEEARRNLTEYFSNCWSSIGIMLPIYNDNPTANKGRLSQAGKIFVPSYKFIINFDGYDLDISPLIIRGRSKEDIIKLKKIEAELLKQDETCAEDIEEFRRANSNNLEVVKTYAASRIASRDLAIRELRRQIDSQFQPKLNTTSCYTTPTSQLNEKGEFDDKSSAGMIAPQIVNPFRAFQIINNPRLIGRDISEEERRMLKEFVIRVYNLQPAIDAVQVTSKSNKKLLLPDANGNPSFNWEDIFREPNPGEEEAFKERNAIINQIIMSEEWQAVPGEYFDIVPGDKTTGRGSSFQFVYALTLETQKRRSGRTDIKNIMQAGDQSSNFQLLGEGLGTLSNNIKSRMIDYLNRVRQEENEALDTLNYSEDSFLNNKEERRSKLLGMINDAGDRDLLLGGVEHLGMKFDDVIDNLK